MGLLLLSSEPTPATPTVPSGARWLAIASIAMDSGTEYVSAGVVNHPTRTYEGRVLDWGSIELSIPTPSGLPRVGDGLIRIADTDRKWRNFLSRQTPRRRRVTTKFLQAGTSEAAASAIYSGEVKDGSFPEGVVELQLRDTTFSWLDEALPELVTQQNFPEFAEVDSAFLPIILGRCTSRAVPIDFAKAPPAKGSAAAEAAGKMADAIAAAQALVDAYVAVDLSGAPPAAVVIWVEFVENPYGQALGIVVNEKDRQVANATITLTELEDARDAVQANIDAFLARGATFIAENVGQADRTQVVANSYANQRAMFGQDWELILDPFDNLIAALTASPPTNIQEFVQGSIPLPHIGYNVSIGDRWAAACHQIWNVLAIYRKLPNDFIFTLVDPAEFDVVEEDREFAEWPGITFRCVFIDFLVAQDDGTEIRMDADGFYFRDTWNGMAAVGYDGVTLLDQGPLRNPVDAFIHLTRIGFINALAETGWDGPGISDVYDKFRLGTPSSPPYFCDGAITESETPREIIGKYLTSFQLDLISKRNGLQSFRFIDDEDTGRPQITEEMMVKGSFREYLANPTCNQLVYRFARNYSEDKWFAQAVYDNIYDQTLLGLIEKDFVDLWFVRHQFTAYSVVSRRMQYLSLGSFQQEWQCPLPLVLDRMEMAQQVGITHRSGLEYVVGYENREVKIIGAAVDLARMSVTFRSILRVPVRLPGRGSGRPTIIEEWEDPGSVNPVRSRIENGYLAIDNDEVEGFSTTFADCGIDSTSSLTPNYAQLFLYGFPEPDPFRTLVRATIKIMSELDRDGATGGTPISQILILNGYEHTFPAAPSTGVAVLFVDSSGVDVPLAEYSQEFDAAEFAAAFPAGAADIYVRCMQGNSLNQTYSTTIHLRIYDCWIEYEYA